MNKLLLFNRLYDINFHKYDIKIQQHELHSIDNIIEAQVLDINNVYHYGHKRYVSTKYVILTCIKHYNM